MAEFALVLLVKRSLEKENIKTIKSYDRLSPKLDSSCKQKEMGVQAGRSTLVEAQGEWFNAAKQREIPPTFFSRRTHLHSFSITTKIDIGAFVFFCSSYAVFNAIYWTSIV